MMKLIPTEPCEKTFIAVVDLVLKYITVLRVSLKPDLSSHFHVFSKSPVKLKYLKLCSSILWECSLLDIVTLSRTQ